MKKKKQTKKELSKIVSKVEALSKALQIPNDDRYLYRDGGFCNETGIPIVDMTPQDGIDRAIKRLKETEGE